MMKVLLWILVSLIGITGLLLLFLNLPFTHRMVTNKVNGVFRNNDLPIHIGTIHTVLPRKISVEDVVISSRSNDTLISVKQLRARFSPTGFLKARVQLKRIVLTGATVELARMSDSLNLDIAEAFAPSGQPKKKEPGENKKSWEISMGRARLEEVSFKMTDLPGGIEIEEQAALIGLRQFQLILEENTILLDELELTDSNGGIRISASTVAHKDEPGKPWNFDLTGVQLDGVDFVFDNRIDSMQLKAGLEEGRIRTRRFDLPNKSIDVDRIRLSGAAVTILSPGSRKEEVKDEADTKDKPANGSGFPWNITAHSITLADSRIETGKYPKVPGVEPVIDETVEGIGLDMSDLTLSETYNSLKLKNLQMKLGNGFILAGMEGMLESKEQSTGLSLSMQTGNSQMKLEARTNRDLFQLTKDKLSAVNGNLNISPSRLSLLDLALFVPGLDSQSWYPGLSSEPLELSSVLAMDQGRISFSQTALSQQDNFRLELEGAISSLFDPAPLNLDLRFRIPGIDSTWLNKLLTDLQAGLSVPVTRFALEGSVEGSIRAPGLDLSLESNLGNVKLEGWLDLDASNYDLSAAIQDLELGKLLSSETLGRFTGSSSVRGSGLDKNNLNASVEVDIDTLGFKGYEYTKTRITGEANADNYEMNLHFEDPCLKGEIQATMDPGLDSMLSVRMIASLEADLYELHLMEDTLSVDGEFSLDYLQSPGSVKAELEVPGMNLSHPAGRTDLGQIRADFLTDTARSGLSVDSDFLHLTSQLGIPMDSLGSMTEAYSKYLKALIDTIPENRYKRISYLPEMEVRGTLNRHPLFSLLLPDTTAQFDSVFFSLSNRSADQKVHYHISGTELKYDQFQSGRLDVVLADSVGQMQLNVDADDNLVNETEIHHLIIGSVFADWKSTTDLAIHDMQENTVYQIQLSTELDKNLLQVEIPSKQLILNREPWNMTDPGLLTIDLASGKVFPATEMHQGRSRIELFSEDTDDVRQYEIRLNEVHLRSLLSEKIIPGNPAALISGSVNFKNYAEEEKKLDARLVVDSIQWHDLSVVHSEMTGSMILPEPGIYTLDLTAMLDSSRVHLTGERPDSLTSKMHAIVTALPIKLISPFAKEYVSDLNGDINGDLQFSNGVDGRTMLGNLSFRDAALRVNSLNSKFRIPADSISFRGRKIVFDKFTVLDSLNNDLQVDGTLDFTPSGEIMTALEITSTRLRVMNKGDDEDASFYGDLIIDSRMTVNGPLENPVIKGRIHLSEGSNISYRHSEDLSLSESEKIIQFVNYSNPEVQENVSRNEMNEGSFQRSSIEAIVDIDPSAQLSFSLTKRIYQIDMKIRGGGSLTYQMLTNRDNTLSGSYQIGEGTAEVKMVGWPNKTFRITEGSYVRWFGEVENPELKIEAVNRVRTNYINPVDGQPRDVDFNVVLQLSNRLADLDLLFTVNTPDQYLMSVINTLSPEEQMRQAITVLLFHKIDLPGISNSSSYVSEQVNQLVADQLNELTKTTIQGVDISFGIDSYVQSTQEGGQQTTTSLSYEIRKDLLDDRAQIEVSGRLNDLYHNPGASNLSVNNISFEYRLDSAATKFLKVYNEHTYEDVFEGEVISTGIGLTFRKRFGTIRDIWKRDTEKKRKKRDRK